MPKSSGPLCAINACRAKSEDKNTQGVASEHTLKIDLPSFPRRPEQFVQMTRIFSVQGAVPAVAHLELETFKILHAFVFTQSPPQGFSINHTFGL